MKSISSFLFFMGIFSFFGSRGQKPEVQPTYETMTSESKTEYRAALHKNPQLPFNDEFIRTTNLEYDLIKRYGFDAIQLIYENNNSAVFFELGKFPEDCPWYHLNAQNKSGCITNNFSPISSKIPDLLKSMRERCLFIYAAKMPTGWQLHYLMNMKLHDGRSYYTIYKGGAPNKNPTPNDNLRKYKWDIPTELKTIYSIHDGFGDESAGMYISGSNELSVMAEIMNPICEEDDSFPEDYKFEDLLEFFPDGGGNGQCFYRAAKNLTVDWDHETWELGEKINFFAFINERMTVVDEE